MVNDDLNAFARVNMELGKAAAETESAALVALLLANPIVGDGVALFAAGHGNLAGCGDVISEATVSAARLALRTQTGISGERISVPPKFLVVGPALDPQDASEVCQFHLHRHRPSAALGALLRVGDDLLRR